ncbi:DUF1294 domain-containing protein [Amphibacillus sediminis]|uniref:DUF1294 domain-containing protein n=1 Tax=Amphibacillus sediminis TaxID=360185 RepID=UPI0008302862|nr:DUF1294 domain-containing protein [Amphibacillus sediminis]
MEVITFYLLLINIVGLMIMKIDKKRAKQHHWRISERTIWLIALIGGAIGVLLGMKTYRHKTKHTTFRFGLPVLALIQVSLLVWFFHFR